MKMKNVFMIGFLSLMNILWGDYVGVWNRAGDDLRVTYPPYFNDHDMKPDEGANLGEGALILVGEGGLAWSECSGTSPRQCQIYNNHVSSGVGGYAWIWFWVFRVHMNDQYQYELIPSRSLYPGVLLINRLPANNDLLVEQKNGPYIFKKPHALYQITYEGGEDIKREWFVAFQDGLKITLIVNGVPSVVDYVELKSLPDIVPARSEYSPSKYFVHKLSIKSSGRLAASCDEIRGICEINFVDQK